MTINEQGIEGLLKVTMLSRALEKC